MKRRLFRATPIITALAGVTLLASVASAAPPASVRGAWVILTDQTYTTLDITNQGGPGGPGGSVCRVIIGSIGIAPIRGFYCPDTGRIHFLHNNLSTGATVRTFTGSVSEDASASMHMAGAFNVVNAAFGPFGEHPFSANR
ncbi:MAG: hypothetical protein ACREV5_18515 [Steroidobacter sp.]